MEHYYQETFVGYHLDYTSKNIKEKISELNNQALKTVMEHKAELVSLNHTIHSSKLIVVVVVFKITV